MVEDIDFLNHGSIEIRDGGNLTFVTSTLENFGTVMGNGELQLVGGTLINHGTIAPGLSPGTLKINGNFQNALDGVIELEIASASVYDVLEFSPGPTLALGGTLRIKLLDGFVPTVDDAFTFLKFGAFTGAFDSIELVGRPGAEFDFTYGATAFRL